MTPFDSLYSHRPHGSWSKLANLIGGDYVNADGSESVSLRVRGGVIILHEYRVGRSSKSTRITASYTSRDDFTFSIHSKTLLHSIAKAFGMQDIEIGDPEFDKTFIVRGSDAARLQALFGNDGIRHRMLSIHPNHRLFFGVTQAENPGVSPVFGGRHEIVWARAGLMGNKELLMALFDLFTEILSQLCEIGSAIEED